MGKITTNSFVITAILALSMSQVGAMPSLAEPQPSHLSLDKQSNGSLHLNIDGRRIRTDGMAPNATSLVKIAGGLGTLTSNLGDMGARGKYAAIVTSAGTEINWNFPDTAPVNINVVGQGSVLLEPQGSIFVPPPQTANESISISQVIEERENGLTTMTTLALNVVVPSENTALAIQSSAIAAAAILPDYTNVRYATFIQAPFVEVPLLGCGVPDPKPFFIGWKFFGGNGRFFSPSLSPSESKTYQNLKIDWLSRAVTYSEKIGTTKVYFADISDPTAYLEYGSRTASGSTLTYTVNATSSSSISFSLKSDVSNPYCMSRGIYYSMRGSVTRSGTYNMSGEFRRVPNHEFYVKDNDEASWRTIFRSYINSDEGGFDCFSPLSSDCILASNWTPGQSPTYPGVLP